METTYRVEYRGTKMEQWRTTTREFLSVTAARRWACDFVRQSHIGSAEAVVVATDSPISPVRYLNIDGRAVRQYP